MSFQLTFLDTNECDRPDSADKGVELALGNWNSDGYWIPLVYYHQSYDRRANIEIGRFSLQPQGQVSLGLRGYSVSARLNQIVQQKYLEICDPEYLNHSHIQFRWLQTSTHPKANAPPVDVWMLDNVTVIYVSGSSHQTLINDNFDSSGVLK